MLTTPSNKKQDYADLSGIETTVPCHASPHLFLLKDAKMLGVDFNTHINSILSDYFQGKIPRIDCSSKNNESEMTICLRWPVLRLIADKEQFEVKKEFGSALIAYLMHLTSDPKHPRYQSARTIFFKEVIPELENSYYPIFTDKTPKEKKDFKTPFIHIEGFNDNLINVRYFEELNFINVCFINGKNRCVNDSFDFSPTKYSKNLFEKFCLSCIDYFHEGIKDDEMKMRSKVLEVYLRLQKACLEHKGPHLFAVCNKSQLGSLA